MILFHNSLLVHTHNTHTQVLTNIVSDYFDTLPKIDNDEGLILTSGYSPSSGFSPSEVNLDSSSGLKGKMASKVKLVSKEVWPWV